MELKFESLQSLSIKLKNRIKQNFWAWITEKYDFDYKRKREKYD